MDAVSAAGEASSELKHWVGSGREVPYPGPGPGPDHSPIDTGDGRPVRSTSGYPGLTGTRPHGRHSAGEETGEVSTWPASGSSVVPIWLPAAVQTDWSDVREIILRSEGAEKAKT